MGCGCFLRTFFSTSFLPSLPSSSCPSTITMVTRRIVTRTDNDGAWLRAMVRRAPIMTGARKPARQPAATFSPTRGTIHFRERGGEGGAFDLSPNFDFQILTLSSQQDQGSPTLGTALTPPGNEDHSLALVDNGLNHSWSLWSGQGQSSVGVADPAGLTHSLDVDTDPG